MSNVRKMIDALPQDDLVKLKNDLDSGGKHLTALITEKIRQLESVPKKVCATCGSELLNNELTLVFGPADFKKKASFCAQDCLEYFLDTLKTKHHVVNEVNHFE